MPYPPPARVLIRGGGEMGSGVAWRLARCGYHVIIAEIDSPTAIRRWVCFSEAVWDGYMEIEGITAVRCTNPGRVDTALHDDFIAVVIEPDAANLGAYRPDVIIDAILAKHGGTTPKGLAKLTVGLGPGFAAGNDVDCVIETNRGPNLGRCIWSGSAEPNTGVPGLLGGESYKRVLRAPCDGRIESIAEIGQIVEIGQVVARVESIEVISQLDGVTRGIMRSGMHVPAGMKIGDVDPRADIGICRRISDKALAIAGGVLEGILSGPRQ